MQLPAANSALQQLFSFTRLYEYTIYCRLFTRHAFYTRRPLQLVVVGHGSGGRSQLALATVATAHLCKCGRRGRHWRSLCMWST